MTPEAAKPRSRPSVDVFWTLATSGVLLLGNALISALLARRGAVDVFGPYNLVKRVAAGLVPLLTLGLTVGVVRFVAGAPSKSKQAAYEVVSVAIFAGIMILSAVAVAVAPAAIGSALLGTKDTLLLWALWGYALALVLVSMLYAFFRASFLQARANLTNMISVVLVPLAVLAVAPSSWSAAVLLIAASVLAVVWCGSQVVYRTWKAIPIASGEPLLVAARELLTYSIPRMPASVALGLMMVAGPWVATRGGNPAAASYVLAGFAFAQIGMAALQSFGTILLPHVSAIKAAGRDDVLAHLSTRLIAFAVAASVVVVPPMIAAARDLVVVWLGPSFLPAVASFQIVAIAVPALAIYTIISSVTDGAIKRPVNTYATVAGFAVCAIGSMMVSSSSPAALSVAYAVGQWVIGGYLLIVAFRELGARPPIGYIVSAAAVGVVLGLATAGTSVLPVPGMPGALLTLVVAGIATAGGLVGVLWFAPESLGYRSTLIQVATNIRTRSA